MSSFVCKIGVLRNSAFSVRVVRLVLGGSGLEITDRVVDKYLDRA